MYNFNDVVILTTLIQMDIVLVIQTFSLCRQGVVLWNKSFLGYTQFLNLKLVHSAFVF